MRRLSNTARVCTWIPVISLALAANAAETRFSLDPAAWEQKLFNTSNVAKADAAVFSVSKDGLSIGPWRAGATGARFEYRQRLPILLGTVRGRYRTTSMYPRQAVVRVQFCRGEESMGIRTFPLAAAPQGRELQIPVFRPPQGADSIRVGFGLGDKTDGKVVFTDLRVVDEYTPPKFEGATPRITRPDPPSRMPSAPFVKVAQSSGAWWLISPAGSPFFSLGSVVPHGRAGESGTEEKLFSLMRALNFNSVAASHDLKAWAAFNDRQMVEGKPVAYQFRTVETRVGDEYDTLVDASDANPGSPQAKAAAGGGFNHAFPDPYDPKWQASVRRRVQEIAAVVKGKPYFAGWFADNEREHRDIHRFVWSKHCSAELMNFLRRKYTSIAALNKDWGSAYASFEDLAQARPDPVLRRGAMYETFRAFSREVIRHFNQTMIAVIRAADPGHLIFSNRFMMGEIRDVLDNLDLYSGFDGIAVNIYPSNITAGLDPAERQFIEAVHQRTGKPILIAEWSVPALDSGLYDNPARLDWSYPQAMETQALRARQAAQIAADLYNLPYVVGAHWFTWNDIDSAVRQANRGLFRANGQPWVELRDGLSALHARMARPER